MTRSETLEVLIACPQCDAVYTADGDTRLVCHRCHTVLVAPSRRAGIKVLLLSLVAVGLVVGAVTQPFLTIERFWMTSDATLLQAALAFEGPPLILSLAVVALVLVLPVMRLLLTLYVLGPVVVGAAPLPRAKQAFMLSETLRPWSMAEIFVLGCGVALVKIVDLAEVTIGPAFWMFAVLVILLWVQDTLVCRFSVWSALDQ